MGGEGFISSANQSLKNRALQKLKKKATTKKVKTLTQIKKSKQLTEEERKAIRTKIIRENLRTNLKISITFIIVVSVLLLSFIWIKN